MHVHGSILMPVIDIYVIGGWTYHHNICLAIRGNLRSRIGIY
jgi:hypothetical protein